MELLGLNSVPRLHHPISVQTLASDDVSSACVPEILASFRYSGRKWRHPSLFVSMVLTGYLLLDLGPSFDFDGFLHSPLKPSSLSGKHTAVFSSFELKKPFRTRGETSSRTKGRPEAFDPIASDNNVLADWESTQTFPQFVSGLVGWHSAKSGLATLCLSMLAVLACSLIHSVHSKN